MYGLPFPRDNFRIHPYKNFKAIEFLFMSFLAWSWIKLKQVEPQLTSSCPLLYWWVSKSRKAAVVCSVWRRKVSNFLHYFAPLCMTHLLFIWSIITLTYIKNLDSIKCLNKVVSFFLVVFALPTDSFSFVSLISNIFNKSRWLEIIYKVKS